MGAHRVVSERMVRNEPTLLRELAKASFGVENAKVVFPALFGCEFPVNGVDRLADFQGEVCQSPAAHFLAKAVAVRSEARAEDADSVHERKIGELESPEHLFTASETAAYGHSSRDAGRAQDRESVFADS